MKNSNREKAKSLKAYYSETTDLRADRITNILSTLERLKLKFPNRTKLSEYVAERLSKEENAPVSSSTIRRNAKYNDLLMNYLINICPESIKTKGDGHIDNILAQRTLRKEIEEKDRTILDLQSKLHEADSLLEKRVKLEYLEKFSSDKSRIDKIITFKEESDASLYEMFYKTLIRLEVMKFDIASGTIYDWENDEMLMNKEKFPKFFKWLSTRI